MRRALPLVLAFAALALTGCRQHTTGDVTLRDHNSDDVWDKHVDDCHLGPNGQIVLYENQKPLLTVYPDQHAVLHAPQGDMNFIPAPTDVYISNLTDNGEGLHGHLSVVFEQGNDRLSAGILIKGCK
ncbi:MAG: hypothetical protein PW792_02075 [Acidobacteriaceae bacterium]|nr:hypothetical protein [Acidobacteriaceae bacterium]